MALTGRGKAIVSVLTTLVVVAGAVVGYLMFTGEGDGLPFLGGERQEVLCPLTGEDAPDEETADRTAVATKIENVPQSRPQAGLNQADIVYEEPVEGGITRFIAIYHCGDAERIGPIRSARFVDPRILVQLGAAVFAYSGGIEDVKRQIRRTGVIEDLNYDSYPDLYPADPNRSAPHNLFTSTQDVLDTAENPSQPPEGIFEFDEEAPAAEASRRARRLHVEFSPATDVEWRFRPGRGRWVRAHGEEAHVTEDGRRISATNVIVMEVEERDTGIVDAAGNPSPEPIVVGEGRVHVFRDGRVIEGRWQRPTVEDVTEFVDENGDVIPLAPGQTWIELLPEGQPIDIS